MDERRETGKSQGSGNVFPGKMLSNVFPLAKPMSYFLSSTIKATKLSTHQSVNYL